MKRAAELRDLLALLLLPAAIVAMGSAHGQTIEELEQKAALEGELSLYAQGPPQVYTDLVRQFEARYPKIKVRITPGRYDVIAKVDEQLKAGKLDADIVTAQTVQHLVRWQRNRQLMTYTPASASDIPSRYKDATGANFFPLSLYLIGSAYNSAQVAEADAPKAVRDFLKPQFKGKIVSTYPHDDDVTLYLYAKIVEKYGWDFVERLAAQDLKFVRSHVLVGELTTSGERPVTFDQISTFNKVKFVAPSDVPMVVFPYVIGSFATAPHANAAKLFLNFSLSKEQQERFVARNIWSARIDVNPPAGFAQLTNYDIASDFIAFISDEQRASELRARFEKILGPIAGEYIRTSPAK